MIWYIGIAIILIGYMLRYIPIGITHPVPVLLAYWILMLPVKYFLMYAVGVSFSVSDYLVNNGGRYLFWFLLATALVHAFFVRVKTGFPLIEARPRFGFMVPTLALMGIVITLYIATNGVVALKDSLKIHIFSSSGIAAYFQIFMEFSAIVTIVQLSEARKKLQLALFFVLITAYFVLLARVGILVALIGVYASYLCMVRRFVPFKALIIVIAIIAPLALVQGMMRLSGGFTEKSFENVVLRLKSRDIEKVLVVLFSHRVDQLEAFASFSGRLDDQTIARDPISPLYIFAQVLPRSVWPDKPKMFTDQMTSYVSPRISAAHTVRNFIGPSEMMYAFGPIIGIIITSLVYGYIFAVFDQYWAFCRNKSYAFLFIFITLGAYINSASQSGLIAGGGTLQLAVNLSLLIAFTRIKINSLPRSTISQSGARVRALEMQH